MRVQLIKFLVGIVFVIFSGTTLFAQDPRMVRYFNEDQSARRIAAIRDLHQPPREK